MGTTGDDDLTARVARLERALAAAGAVLEAPPEGRRSGTKTPPLAKGVRTAVQIAVASVPGLILAVVADLDPAVAAAVALVLTPVVTAVQNQLEDDGDIPAFLRDLGDDPRRQRGRRRQP